MASHQDDVTRADVAEGGEFAQVSRAGVDMPDQYSRAGGLSRSGAETVPTGHSGVGGNLSTALLVDSDRYDRGMQTDACDLDALGACWLTERSLGPGGCVREGSGAWDRLRPGP